MSKKKIIYLILFIAICILVFVFIIMPFGKESDNGQNKPAKETEEKVERKYDKNKEESNKREDDKQMEIAKETTTWGCNFNIGETKHYYEVTLMPNGQCYFYIVDGYSEPAPPEKTTWRYDDEKGGNNIIVFANDKRMYGVLEKDKLVLDGREYFKVDKPLRSD